ncbi:tripartite tricarboxylate transporter TctB family protein [Paramicrobacterium humi]|nr:tripartite tricarboxylate transporter TctB family protein [Microbacterium humi]
MVEEMEREVSALQAKPSRWLERVIALSLVGLCVLGIIGSRLIEVRTETGGIDPRWWPTLMCGISLGLSLLLTVIAFTRPPFDREDLEVTNRGGWLRLVCTIVLSALYIVAWTLSGNFVVPSVILLVALMWVYDGRGWKALVIYPIATVAFIYLLFHTLLKVPL